MSTRGRAKRKRAGSAGSSVSVKPHSRSPRGANKGKPRVRVDNYLRGKPGKKKQRRKSRKRTS